MSSSIGSPELMNFESQIFRQIINQNSLRSCEPFSLVSQNLDDSLVTQFPDERTLRQCAELVPLRNRGA